MRVTERYTHVITWFKTNMPEAKSELNYSNPFELIVAVVLSAQCTDKRVNIVTPSLFRNFPTPQLLAQSSDEEIFSYIKSVTFPNNKSKHLLGLARLLVEEFNSEVPDNLEDLQRLPGVGRKTASVVLAVAFDQPAMPVDTHVFRVSNRIGLSRNATTPLEVEKQLRKHIPDDLLSLAHHWILLHGRYVCVARRPKCENCGIRDYCEFFNKRK